MRARANGMTAGWHVADATRADPRPLVLVEPYAGIGGGHSMTALRLLTKACQESGRRCVVIALNGIHVETRNHVENAGATIVTSAKAAPVGALLLRYSRHLLHLHERLVSVWPQSSFPYQALHLSRCLGEAASLRVARDTLGEPISAVLLTANGTLHGSACALARVHHVRFVHETGCREGRLIRTVEVLARPTLRYGRFFCPTARVAQRLTHRHPAISPRVRTFALRDPDAYASRASGEAGGSAAGLSERRPLGSLVGGWWSHKDTTAVADALPLTTEPFTLLIAGAPLDHRLLECIRIRHRGSLRVLDRPLSAEDYRAVLQASDFTIVSRRRDGKESGVALDAIQHGTPLVTSDHDPDLIRKLAGTGWARTFAAGDPASLAAALDDVCRNGLTRPPPTAADAFGLIEGRQLLDVFDAALADGSGQPAAATEAERRRHVDAHARARSSKSSRSRALRVSAAARWNSAWASSKRLSLASRSPRTLGRRW